MNEKMCKNCTLLNTAVSAIHGLDEVPQLDGRKFPEALLDLALRPLQEDPARGAVPLAAREVQPPPHRPGPHVRVGLYLHEDVPSLVATLQLTHVLGAVVPGKRSAHGPSHDGTTPRATSVCAVPRVTWRRRVVSRVMPSTLRCPETSRQLDFPPSMNCHACGAALAATAKFCHRCGAPVSGAPAAGWRAGLPWGVAGGAGGGVARLLSVGPRGCAGRRKGGGGRRGAGPVSGWPRPAA